MTEFLDIIDSSLQEVEELLLQEFERIRNTLSDSRYEPIDPGVRNALTEVTDDLYNRLDQSGDNQNLSLMTERHEVLLSRIVVLRRLLDAKVPTAYLHEAHSEVVSNRKQLEARVNAKRQAEDATPSEPAAEKRGFMGKLKGFFGDTNKTEKEISRNRIKITEQEIKALEPVSIYLDNGIYSASRELAALANVFSLPKEVQEKIQAEHKRKVEGKALFESRDLTAQKAEATPDRGIAQTPEDIRRKLAERQGNSVGKASFGSKDIVHVAAKEAAAKEAAPKKPSPIDAATARRAEIEAEKAKQPTSGKASFFAKDIEPIQPQEVRKKEDLPQSVKKPEPVKPISGKAVFESRDLSNPSPSKKN